MHAIPFIGHSPRLSIFSLSLMGELVLWILYGNIGMKIMDSFHCNSKLRQEYIQELTAITLTRCSIKLRACMADRRYIWMHMMEKDIQIGKRG